MIGLYKSGCMKLTGYKVKDKKALGLFAAAVVILMFVIRFILVSNGTIDEMYTLDEEELAQALTAYEVTVVAVSSSGEETYVGGGTILDARKASTSDEDYTLTIAAALSITGTEDEERLLTVTLPDGTTESAELTAFDEEDGYALIQCLYAEELEVYYSRDILYRLAGEDPIYVLSDESVVEGTVTATDLTVDEVEDELIAAALGETVSDTVRGAGLYGKSGNYLGLILDTGEDGAVLRAIPGDIIMAALNDVV